MNHFRGTAAPVNSGFTIWSFYSTNARINTAGAAFGTPQIIIRISRSLTAHFLHWLEDKVVFHIHFCVVMQRGLVTNYCKVIGMAQIHGVQMVQTTMDFKSWKHPTIRANDFYSFIRCTEILVAQWVLLFTFNETI